MARSIVQSTNAAIAVSGGNLIATYTGSNSDNFILSNAYLYNGGKYYWEVVNNVRGGGAIFVGVSGPGVITGGNYLGKLNTGMGWNSDGRVTSNNATVTTIQTYAAGDTLCIAVDLVNAVIWFRTNGGNWNNSGTANPATNVGGISISTLLGLVPYLVPALCTFYNNDKSTINFGATSFTQTAPSGFSTADSSGPPSYFANGAVADHAASFTQYGRFNGPGSPVAFTLRLLSTTNQGTNTTTGRGRPVMIF